VPRSPKAHTTTITRACQYALTARARRSLLMNLRLSANIYQLTPTCQGLRTACQLSWVGWRRNFRCRTVRVSSRTLARSSMRWPTTQAMPQAAHTSGTPSRSSLGTLASTR